MKVFEWKKPTITLYRERRDPPEKEPFVVLKARRITLEALESVGFTGTIDDFFTLMGDIQYISSPDGKKDQYVLCWFDDNVEDFDKAFRKLRGVTFPHGISSIPSENKELYKASLQAEQGKIS
jgi:hypothetical protein